MSISSDFLLSLFWLISQLMLIDGLTFDTFAISFIVELVW